MEVTLALGSSPSPFSSAVSPPHSVGGLSQSRPLSGEFCSAKVDSRQSGPPSYWS